MADPRSTPADLVQGIVTDLQNLIRGEVSLARSEIQEIVQEVKVAAPSMAGGGGAMAVGGLMLVIAAAEGVASALNAPRWVGYTLVGLGLTGGGYALLRNGQQQLEHAKLVPEQTIQTMQDNAEWLKERTVGENSA